MIWQFLLLTIIAFKLGYIFAQRNKKIIYEVNFYFYAFLSVIEFMCLYNTDFLRNGVGLIQSIWLFMMFITLLVCAIEHKKLFTKVYNFNIAFVESVIKVFGLYWCGFFNI